MLMISQKKFNKPNEILDEVLSGLENWCEVFNEFILIFFIFMKYIFVFVLFGLGLLTLLKLRRIYFNVRVNNPELDEDPLKKERLVLGITYIFLGLGILFNYLTLFLILILEPIPDRFIFKFLNFHGGINPEYMNRIEDIEASKYPHEKTIYYCFALVSFYAILNLVISLWLLLHNRPVDKPRSTVFWLIQSVFLGLLFGFTTCLPFFL